MKTYVALSMSVVRFNDVDIITTSGEEKGAFKTFNRNWLFTSGIGEGGAEE